VAETKRSIYFYQVEMHDGTWNRAEVLRRLDALSHEALLLDLGEDNYAWATIDRIPQGQQSGRVRLFKEARANLPGMARGARVEELPIPDDAGLIEPTHVVLAGNGLIAAEFNNSGPRITTTFAALLRTKLDLDLSIGTYVQGDILDQLDRLQEVKLLEFSLVATPSLQQELRNAGSFGDAAASLSTIDDGKRLHLTLSGDRHSESWGAEAVAFAKRLFGLADQGRVTKVLKVTGYDPASENEETVDLLKQKLVRRGIFERSSQRSKVLNVSSAYQHIEDAISEVRQTDLPNARMIR
jgi:hypothetical protein